MWLSRSSRSIDTFVEPKHEGLFVIDVGTLVVPTDRGDDKLRCPEENPETKVAIAITDAARVATKNQLSHSGWCILLRGRRTLIVETMAEIIIAWRVYCRECDYGC